MVSVPLLNGLERIREETAARLAPMLRSSPHRLSQPWVAAALVFLLAAGCAAAVVGRWEQHRLQAERARVSDQTGDQARAIQRHIERALSATYALAALVRQGNGTVANFASVAQEMLPFYPGVSALALAPGGIVRYFVPLAGNEKAIGHDLLKDPARTREAFLARDTGRLTLAGPFNLIQGGLGAAGRLPVFLDDGQSRSFWGFTIVLLRFPEALDPNRLSGLVERGFVYRLWRIHPDSGQGQVIAESSPVAPIDPVEHTLDVPNATWTLSVAPVRGWGDPPGLALKAGLGLLFSLLLAYLTKLLVELKLRQQRLETLTAAVQDREADLSRAQAVAQVGSWVFDFIRNEVRGSAEACRINGWPEGARLGYRAFMKRVYPNDRKAVTQAWRAALAGAVYDVEHRIVVGAAIRWVREQAELEFDAQGAPLRCVGTVQDITERKRAEIALRVALEEKTALLKEVHHRVKNNLQIVTSLLNLQAGQIQNPIALAALQDTQGRIRSMALLHESLYHDSRGGRVDGAAYLSHLCAHLRDAFGLAARRVRLHHDLAPVQLGLDQAVPCGLIVNELVSNACKHAFPGERGGEIWVELRAESADRLELVVIDDGAGLPPGLDWRRSDTLGLHLVAGLAQQLGATVEAQATAGTRFRLTFLAQVPSGVPLP